MSKFKNKSLRVFALILAFLMTFGSFNFGTLVQAANPTAYTVEYKSNRTDAEVAAVELPQTATVAEGTEITLPNLTPDKTENYSFMGWDTDGDSNVDSEPGQKYTVNNNTVIKAIWEKNYGKATFTFHTGEYKGSSWKFNKEYERIADLTGYEVVFKDEAGNVISNVETDKKGQIRFEKLPKGTYSFEIKVPAGMKVVKIVDSNETSSEGPVVEYTGNKITLPFMGYNLTMAKSLMIEVVEDLYTVEYKSNRTEAEIVAVELPETQKVVKGTEITLPNLTPDKTEKYSFLGWDTNGDGKVDLDPGAVYTVNENTVITAIWDGNYGKAIFTFHTGEYKGSSWKFNKEYKAIEDLTGYEIVFKDEAGNVISNVPTTEKGQIRFNKLPKGTYSFEIKVPVGMKIVKIVDSNETGSEGPVVENVGNKITLPFINYNMTMAKSLMIQVVEDTYTISIEEVEGVTIPEEIKSIKVKKGGTFLISYESMQAIRKEGYTLKKLAVKSGRLHINRKHQPPRVTEIKEYEVGKRFLPKSDIVLTPVFEVTTGTANFNVFDKDAKKLVFTLTDAEGNQLKSGKGSRTQTVEDGVRYRYQIHGVLEKEYTLTVEGYDKEYTLTQIPVGGKKTAAVVEDNGIYKFTFEFMDNKGNEVATFDIREVKYTVEYKSNRTEEKIAAIELPEVQKVSKGTEITLPNLTPDKTEKYSFLGWDIDGDGEVDLEAGQKYTVNENTVITAIWEKNYGKATFTFHTGEYKGSSWKFNKEYERIADLTGYEVVFKDEAGNVISNVETDKKGQIRFERLPKGTYSFEIKVPKNVKIVKIVDVNETSSEGPVVEYVGNTITLPFINYNLTMAKSLMIEVVEENPYKLIIDTSEEGVVIEAGKEIVEFEKEEEKMLPYNFQLKLARKGYSLAGYKVLEGRVLVEGQEVTEFGEYDKVKLLSDSKVKPVWELTKGELIVQLSGENATVQEGFNIYVVDKDGEKYKLTSDTYSSNYRQWEVENLVNGEYTLHIDNMNKKQISKITKFGHQKVQENSSFTLNEDGTIKFNLVFLDDNSANSFARFRVELKEKEVTPPIPTPEPTPKQETVKLYAKDKVAVLSSKENGEVKSHLLKGEDIKGIVDGDYLKVEIEGGEYYIELDKLQENQILVSGYAKFTQYVRDSKEKVVSTISRNESIEGRLIGDRVYLNNNLETKVWQVNIVPEKVSVQGYTKFLMNMRNAEGEIIGVIQKGVYFEGQLEGERLLVKYNGLTGYIYTANLSTTRPIRNGYTKFTQYVRNAKGEAFATIRAGRYVSGPVIDGKVQIVVGGNIGYIYDSNISYDRTFFVGQAKFDQWIRNDKEEKIGILEKGALVGGKVSGKRVYIEHKGMKGKVWILNLE